MMFTKSLMAFAAVAGVAVAIETHGGVQFDIRWTNTSAPLDTPIKDACKFFLKSLIDLCWDQRANSCPQILVASQQEYMIEPVPSYVRYIANQY